MGWEKKNSVRAVSCYVRPVEVLERPKLAVKTEATKPERAVRAALLRLGLTFDCNVKGVPGTPDIVLPGKRAIFVHGCWFHAHDCPRGKAPSIEWRKRQAFNVAHDLKNESELLRGGWQVFTVWECETGIDQALECLLRRLLA